MESKIKNQQAFAVKLYKLGIEISGSNSNGAVWDKDGNDISEREDIKALILEHNNEQPEENGPFPLVN
jgi:hypothetical protein